MIGGRTEYDDMTEGDAAAIEDIMEVWLSAATYDERVGTLTGSLGLLEAGETVFNDDATDVFIGGSGLDVYFADLSEDMLLFVSSVEEIIDL
jgi:hypothetical protein